MIQMMGMFGIKLIHIEVTTSGQAEIRFASAPRVLSPDDVLSFGQQALI